MGSVTNIKVGDFLITKSGRQLRVRDRKIRPDRKETIEAVELDDKTHAGYFGLREIEGFGETLEEAKAMAL